MSDQDWVVIDNEWVHKKELERWPAEKIHPELWAAVLKQYPNENLAFHDRMFWDMWDYLRWQEDRKKT